MRILVVSAYYWPEISGTAPYVTAPAEYLASKGHAVDVIATFPHYPQWRELAPRSVAASEIINGVHIHRRWHTIPSVQSARSRALYEASMLGFGSTALAAVPRPDVIVGVTPALASGTLAYAAAKAFRRPWGLVVHDLMGRGATQSGVGSGRVGGAVERIELGVAGRADRLLVLAEGMKRFFTEGGTSPALIDVVPTWTLRSPPEIDRRAVRRSVGWAEEERVFLHGGNMGQKQGLGNVIDALALVQSRGVKGIRVVLLGDGNDRSRLERLARERHLEGLEFFPMQPVERYDELVAAADILLLNQRPSVADMSLPSKLSAYFASGRPVLAAVSKESPAGAEMERSGAGVIVDPSSPAALGAELERLRSFGPEELERMGEAGRAYADRALSAEAILPQYERFVESLAGC